MKKRKTYRIGYTQGVYDMFHVGHLRLINHAKELCDYLIVGVNADELVQSYKDKKPVISQEERAEIVRNIRAVDECVIVSTLDKTEILKNFRFDAVFIGDDWKGHPRWVKTEEELKPFHVDVVYLPHTDGISSTQLRPSEQDKIDE